MNMSTPFTLICVLFGFFYLQCAASETVKEAARLARALVDSNDAAGTLATVFPMDHPTLPGQPFALMEYYASCHENGSLTFIFMPISQNNRNILHSLHHSATITVATHPARAASARASLMGNVTIILPGESAVNTKKQSDNSGAVDTLRDTEELETKEAIDTGDAFKDLEHCFLKRHPDARLWIPGKKPAHTAYWARFDPLMIYYVGGFGSEHYIGWIPLSMYQEAHLQLHPTSGELRTEQQLPLS